jgi:hypothetical protein
MPHPSLSKNDLYPSGILRRIIAVARIADGTRHTSTAAATGIVTGAHASPRLGFMVLADPARSVTRLAFRRHYYTFSRCDRLFHHAAPGPAVAGAITYSCTPATRWKSICVCARIGARRVRAVRPHWHADYVRRFGPCCTPAARVASRLSDQDTAQYRERRRCLHRPSHETQYPSWRDTAASAYSETPDSHLRQRY